MGGDDEENLDVSGSIACTDCEGTPRPPHRDIQGRPLFLEAMGPQADLDAYASQCFFTCQEDETTTEIFAALPEYWDTPTIRRTVCSFTADERIELLQTIMDNDWTHSSEEQFRYLMQWVDETVQQIRDAIEPADKRCSLAFYQTNFLRGLWYLCIYEQDCDYLP